ncbi:MAG: 50S ribosome-binding GTPase [Planctomycetes bacterium]|nr:50S ribosome-binding GTPase [Planctomycetota bacterium]
MSAAAAAAATPAPAPAPRPAAGGDTIVALSSPPGAGTRAVLRLSGPAAVACASAVLAPPGCSPERGARPARLALPGFPLALEVWTFPAPRSYTREEVVELHLPGAAPLVAACLEALYAAGARPAEPGEFTRRAFLNGRLDLAQAESVMAVLTARSREELRLAARRLEGGFSRALGALAERLLDVRVRIEAEIDFSDQDLPAADLDRLRAEVEGIGTDLAACSGREARAECFRVLPTVALVGAPNAGKSSLFNRLAAAGARALVHHEPGTTRDVVEGEAEAEGVRYRLLDTAGLRGAAGELEQRAMALARQAGADADLVLLVLDGARPLGVEEQALLAAGAGTESGPAGDGARLVVENKSDVPAAARRPLGLRVSAATGDGLAELRVRVAERLRAGTDRGSAAWLVNVRQAAALARAGEALTRAEAALAGAGAVAAPALDLAAADLVAAHDAIGEILGRVTPEDLLGAIFGRFCIGK